MKRFVSSALAIACAALAAPLSAAAAQGVAVDTPGKTAAGVAYLVPKAWSVTVRGPLVVITAPEGDVHVGVFDAGAAPSADAAAAAAWKAYDPSMHRKIVLAQPSPGRNGWDAERDYTYATSPNEHLDVEASVLRRGTQWTAVLLVGSQSTEEKRAAAVGQIIAGVVPGGYKKETFAGQTAHRLDAQRIAELTSFVQTGMAELRVPGTAIALVDHGKVVFEGGFGVRQLGDPTPVDTNTLFMIASNTKGLTTLLLARLVDQGKLQWDEPVTQAYPPFRLGDDATTSKVEIRHLICACTGVPRRDYDWILNTNASTPPQSTFDQLAKTQPTSGFGEVFQYSNLMASAAGYIAGHILYPDESLAPAYREAMQTQVFDPLGMSETTFDMKAALGGNHASPHGNSIEGKTVVESMDVDMTSIPIAPAGGAWSSAHDLIKYMEDEITGGVLPDGSRFVSQANLFERRTHSVLVDDDIYYGMGLMDDRRYGISVLHHGGDLIGFHSDVIAIPSAQVGAVILTNADLGGDLPGPFLRRLLEVLYDGKPEAAADLAAAAKNDWDAMAKERALLTVPADPAVAAQLAKRYTNPDLGHIDVSSDSQGLVFDFGAWKSRMASRKHPDGTVSLVTIDPGVTGLRFTIAKSGTQRELVIRDSQHAYTYVEAPPSGP